MDDSKIETVGSSTALPEQVQQQISSTESTHTDVPVTVPAVVEEPVVPAVEVKNVEDEEAEEDDDQTYESDEEITADDLARANPQDFTKLYNRTVKLQAPTTADDQKPAFNAQITRKPKANVGASLDDQISSLSHHAGSIRLNAYGGSGGTKGELRKKDKSDRATKDQVMDKRTQLILLKLANRGIFHEFYDVALSTGKEANVYHAVTYPPKAEAAEAAAAAPAPIHGITHFTDNELDKSKPKHMAIKIFKTRILDFRDRDKYVSGEWRFQGGYNKNSNLSKVKLWAEKEFRNLNRIHASGIPSPNPFLLKSHVLLMSYLGDGHTGEHAPKLREIDWEVPCFLAEGETKEGKIVEIYCTILSYMRVMYQDCKLVHGDLSEYNILYHHGRPWIIDVSQSVEHSHPRSLEMLRIDIQNINTFFSRQGVDTLPDRVVYEFITTESVAAFAAAQSVPLPVAPATVVATTSTPTAPTEGTAPIPLATLPSDTLNIHNPLLASIMDSRAQKQAKGELTEDSQVDNLVFRKQYIPQTLEQVYDFERDALKVGQGEGADLPYRHLLAGGAEMDAIPAKRAVTTTVAADGSETISSTKTEEGKDVSTENAPDDDEDATGSDSEDSDDTDSDSDSDSEDEDGVRKADWIDKGPPRGHRFQDKEEKKTHKESVRKEKAEKRLVKMPKHEKKKLVKARAGGAKKKK